MKQIYWINQKGDKIALPDMNTPYLYNTVKMIWNNSIAPNNPFGNVISWTFKENHPKDYLIKFFNIGLAELEFDRKDNEIARDFIIHVTDHLNKIFLPILDELREDMHELEEDFGDK